MLALLPYNLLLQISLLLSLVLVLKNRGEIIYYWHVLYTTLVKRYALLPGDWWCPWW